MAGIPPPPLQDAAGSFSWLEWYRQLRDYVSTASSIPWNIINFAGSKLTDLQQRGHSDLQNIQGGVAGERYHLTLAQLSAVTPAAPVVTATTAYTVTVNNLTILCNAATAGFAVTLPLASTLTGRQFNIKKIDATTNVVTVTPTAPNTVDGSATAPITIPNISITVQSDGSNWYVL
jgi:hypothetical protein